MARSNRRPYPRQAIIDRLVRTQTRSKKRSKQACVEEFDPDRVRPLPNQPRKRFRGIKELADSITEIGQATPGIVTLVSDDPKFDAQLVDGERRLRACKLAGRTFRAEVKTIADADSIFAASFGANFGKQDHDAIEIAEGLSRLEKMGRTREQLARIAGKSIGWVGQHLSLLKLHDSVQALMVPRDETPDEPPPLTFMLGLLLTPLPHDEQIRIARKIVKSEMSLSAARRMVLRERLEIDEKKGGEGLRRSYQRSIGAIESILEDMFNRIGIYLDMPGEEFNRLIDETDHRTKRDIVKLVAEIVENMQGLSEAVAARLPKLAVRGA